MLFSQHKVKKLDADDINCKLGRVCESYIGDSTISGLKGYAKNCFETLQTYRNVDNCKPDKIMYVCCYRWLKILIHYILSDIYFYCVQYLKALRQLVR